MAEINTTGGLHKKATGVKKSKKLSTRVDLTPMVDLGFLLITFFIFTTRISQPTALKLFLPADGEPTRYKQSASITFLLGRNDVVYYYEGQLNPDAPTLTKTSYSGIRDAIINKKKYTNDKDMVVIIKPHKESIYKNAVDALDEMTINNVKHYAMVDISVSEDEYIRIREKENIK